MTALLPVNLIELLTFMFPIFKSGPKLPSNFNSSPE